MFQSFNKLKIYLISNEGKTVHVYSYFKKYNIKSCEIIVLNVLIGYKYVYEYSFKLC